MNASQTRRTFLAASAAGLAVPYVTHAQSQSSKKNVPDAEKVGFAIVGLGGFSMRQMLPNFRLTDNARPVALVTGNPSGEKANRVAGEYQISQDAVVSYDEIGKLADNDDVQVAYIATPTGLHAEHTIAALEAGKHVMCEKPMAGTVEECDAMIVAAKKAGRKLMIAYRVHYEPFNQRAMEWGTGKKFGPVRHFAGQISYDMSGEPTWRNDPKLAGGGGPLMDLGIYMLNASRYTTGEEPATISAQTFRPEGNPLFPEGIESRCVWQATFPSGATASCVTAYDMASTNRYRVIQTDRWFELEPATNYGGLRMFYKDGRETVEVDDIEPANQFAAELQHMAECVRDDREPDTPGSYGRQDVYLMKKIYEAAETGRTLDV